MMIDGDNSGNLSANELKEKLGEQYDEAYYSKLMKFFDEDKDGEVDVF
jgi:Ca2+-binding EF-hand superfamily protein